MYYILETGYSRNIITRPYWASRAQERWLDLTTELVLTLKRTVYDSVALFETATPVYPTCECFPAPRTLAKSGIPINKLWYMLIAECAFRTIPPLRSGVITCLLERSESPIRHDEQELTSVRLAHLVCIRYRGVWCSIRNADKGIWRLS